MFFRRQNEESTWGHFMQQKCDINDLTAEHSFTKVFNGVLGADANLPHS